MNNIQEKKSYRKVLVFTQLVLYVSMLSGYRGTAYYIALAALVLYFFGEQIYNTRFNINNDIKCFIVFLIYYMFTSLIYNYNFSNMRVYLAYYFIIFTPVLISQQMIKYEIPKTMKRSLAVFLLAFTVFCIISIGYFIATPGLARQMASHQVEEQLFIGGGYHLAYAACILCVYFFSKYINKRYRKKWVLLFLPICFVLVYLTESTITTFSMVIGLLISVVAKAKEIEKIDSKAFIKRVGIVIVFIVIAGFIYLFKYEIGTWVLNILRNKEETILTRRVTEIVNSFLYGRTTSHYDKRTDALWSSIEIFKQYPIFGIGYKYSNYFAMGKYMYSMGNHSEILDSLARYGVVGGYFLLMPFLRVIGKLIKNNIGCSITISLLMFFNPFLSFHTSAVLFFVIPVLEHLLKIDEID